MMQLSYCTNVHPAEDLGGVLEQLHTHAGPARRAAGLDVLGVGLWMPAALASTLAADPGARARLRAALDGEGLELRTVNAFPYAAFHADVVKLDVYLPDWTTEERLRATLDAAEVLADLLPEGAEGSISTLPLGWREGWTPERDAAAEAMLARLVDGLTELRARTARTVRIAIEPEPGCILDTVADIVAWLAPRRARIDPELIGVCLDTCHLAVSWADPRGAVDEVHAAGLRIVKVQASAALHVARPGEPAHRAALAPFAEPRYLHQVRESHPDRGVLPVDDLPDALESLPAEGPWRVHFHMPLGADAPAPLTATTEVLRQAVAAVTELYPDDEIHLDVETYTWSVLPEPPESLVAGIAAEVRWAHDELIEGRVG